MTKRIQRLFLSVAALGVLALGGSAIASAQTGANHAKPVSHAADATGTSGSQNAPDTGGSTETAGESASAEQPSSAEQPGSEQPGSESAANSDGPGGHADDPGNATADYQFQGQE